MSEIWERTGRIKGTAAESVLYQLLRDGDIAPGRIEKLVQEAESTARRGVTEFRLSNGFIGLYAQDVIARLERLR